MPGTGGRTIGQDVVSDGVPANPKKSVEDSALPIDSTEVILQLRSRLREQQSLLPEILHLGVAGLDNLAPFEIYTLAKYLSHCSQLPRRLREMGPAAYAQFLGADDPAQLEDIFLHYSQCHEIVINEHLLGFESPEALLQYAADNGSPNAQTDLVVHQVVRPGPLTEEDLAKIRGLLALDDPGITFRLAAEVVVNRVHRETGLALLLLSCRSSKPDCPMFQTYAADACRHSSDCSPYDSPELFIRREFGDASFLRAQSLSRRIESIARTEGWKAVPLDGNPR